MSDILLTLSSPVDSTKVIFYDLHAAGQHLADGWSIYSVCSDCPATDSVLRWCLHSSGSITDVIEHIKTLSESKVHDLLHTIQVSDERDYWKVLEVTA